jgi:hemerythrin
MKLLEWKLGCRVGNVAVDHEHRELIDLTNKIHAGTREGVDRDHERSAPVRSVVFAGFLPSMLA